MACFNPEPTHANPPFAGIKIAKAAGDGYAIDIEWYKAYSPRMDYRVLYNIFYSTNFEDVFGEGIKFTIISDNQTETSVSDLIPGDVYYFAVRPSTLPINDVNFAQLPSVNGMYIFPEGILLDDIGDFTTNIPVSDIETFPSYGIIKLGREIIGYSSIDIPNSLLISSYAQRGLYNTEPRMHTTDGYDGYVFSDPLVQFFEGFMNQNTSIMLSENSYSPFKYAYTDSDGYKEKDSAVYPNTDISDCLNENFKKWDYSGYSRTRPEDYINGKVSDSYFGGEFYCADGYGSVGTRIRGLTLQDHQNQREELLLETYGRPMVLLRRQVKGKVSMHYDNKRENTVHRGIDSFNDLVLGYEQFFNQRRSDGRILVRFDPTVEDIERSEMGLENKFRPNAWTLPYPTLKDGDVLIAFNGDGTEEFRYEIINVTRNTTFSGTDGRQLFTAVRIRKTDPINQFRAINDTSMMPSQLTTSIGMVSGAIPPHVHTVTINEGVVTLSQINQTTSVEQGHNHVVIDGVIQEVLSHNHTLVL